MTRQDSILTRIRQAAYSAYTLIAFILLMMLVVQPAIFFYFLFGKTTERKRLRYHRAIQRLAISAIHHVPGVKLDYNNATGERFDKPLLIISNHQSHLDLMCVLMLAPKIVVLTNDWVWRNPLYGLLIRYAEFYPVSDGLETNIERLRNLAERGYSIMAFPEGTRSADGRVHRFHKGAFYLAEQLGLDILPMFIHGADRVLNKKARVLKKGTIYVEIAPRITADDTTYGKGYRERTRGIREYYLRHFADICRQREKQREGGDA